MSELSRSLCGSEFDSEVLRSQVSHPTCVKAERPLQWFCWSFDAGLERSCKEAVLSHAFSSSLGAILNTGSHSICFYIPFLLIWVRPLIKRIVRKWNDASRFWGLGFRGPETFGELGTTKGVIFPVGQTSSQQRPWRMWGHMRESHGLYLSEVKASSLWIQDQSYIRPRKSLLARILKHEKKMAKAGYLEVAKLGVTVVKENWPRHLSSG